MVGASNPLFAHQATIFKIRQIVSGCLVGDAMARLMVFGGVTRLWVPQRVAEQRTLAVIQSAMSLEKTVHNLDLPRFTVDETVQIVDGPSDHLGVIKQEVCEIVLIRLGL